MDEKVRDAISVLAQAAGADPADVVMLRYVAPAGSIDVFTRRGGGVHRVEVERVRPEPRPRRAG